MISAAATLPQGIAEEQVAGIRLLRRRGAGRGLPIVLLHGIGSNAGSWVRTVEALGPEADVLAWNAPGYAGSTPVGPAQPTPKDYAERLGSLLSELGVGPVLLVGHSLGCLFAARFAEKQPDSVAGLVLLSPALGYATPAGQPLPPGVQARADELAALGPEAFAAKRADRLVHRPEAKPEIAASVRRAMAAVDPVGYGQAVRALGSGDLLADAARLTTPVLVAAGAEDVVTPPDNARRLHAAVPADRHAPASASGPVFVPDVGHALPQEAPAIVAGFLRDFAEGLR